MAELFSKEIERHLLGGVIQNPEVLSEIESHISDSSFVHTVHGVIYNCLKSLYLNNEKIDKVILGQKIKNLGIAFKDSIDIFDYIEAISFTPINAKATINAAKELVKLQALRELKGTCSKIITHLEGSANQDFSKTVSEVDAIYGEKINAFESDSEPEDLFSNIVELIEERGNSPIDNIGLLTGFKDFDNFYGGLRDKNLYFIISRAKAGKTSFLNQLALNVNQFNKVPVLYLDTEMSRQEMQLRTAANLTGVKLWYLETGNFRKDKEMVEKVRGILPNNPYKNVQHYHIGDKTIEEIESICRRWALKVKGRDNKGLIIYDYLKIAEPTSGGHWNEFQEVGRRVNRLKKLTEELNIPIFTAGQSNRSGIVTNKKSSEIIEDEGVIGMSDRISWYASYVGLLRRKTQDEVVLDGGLISGTHFLKELVSRWLGRDAMGHFDLILRKFPDGSKKFVKNYINFNFDNFRVTECGSLADSIKRQNASFLITDPHSADTHKELL